jgi:hypothetical protein
MLKSAKANAGAITSATDETQREAARAHVPGEKTANESTA